MNCMNCGTKLSNGICQWCQEELFIVNEQYEFLPDSLSEDFIDKVKRQKEDVKNKINQ